MKKIFIPSILAMCFIAFSIESCSPYEEGPDFSFRSPTERISNIWKYEYALENGRDVKARYENTTIEMTVDGALNIVVNSDTGIIAEQKGYWKFTNEENDVFFLYSEPMIWPDRDTMQILKLKEKELWLRDVKDTVTIEYRFIPN